MKTVGQIIARLEESIAAVEDLPSYERVFVEEEEEIAYCLYDKLLAWIKSEEE